MYYICLYYFSEYDYDYDYDFPDYEHNKNTILLCFYYTNVFLF